jgi:hypothetical protein
MFSSLLDSGIEFDGMKKELALGACPPQMDRFVSSFCV